MSDGYDYDRPRRRPRHAVESNAARSPTRAGQHPHMVRDDRNYNNQSMYDGQAPGQMPRQLQGMPTRPPPQDDFWGKLLLAGAVLGIGVLVGKAMSGDNEEEPRQNPSIELPVAPPQPTVVVVPPAGISVSAPVMTPAQPLMLAPPQVIEPQVVDIPQPVLQTVATPVSAVVVEDKAPKRTRRTTQARTETGKYEKAGTRTRAVVEGKD